MHSYREDRLYVQKNTLREFPSVDPNHPEHSSLPEDNEEYKIVVCYNHIHMSVKMLACCPKLAESFAFQYFNINLGLIVDIAEIWSPGEKEADIAF